MPNKQQDPVVVIGATRANDSAHLGCGKVAARVHSGGLLILVH